MKLGRETLWWCFDVTTCSSSKNGETGSRSFSLGTATIHISAKLNVSHQFTAKEGQSLDDSLCFRWDESTVSGARTWSRSPACVMVLSHSQSEDPGSGFGMKIISVLKLCLWWQLSISGLQWRQISIFRVLLIYIILDIHFCMRRIVPWTPLSIPT